MISRQKPNSCIFFLLEGLAKASPTPSEKPIANFMNEHIHTSPFVLNERTVLDLSTLSSSQK